MSTTLYSHKNSAFLIDYLTYGYPRRTRGLMRLFPRDQLGPSVPKLYGVFLFNAALKRK